jgi:hypothetical protein
MFLFFRLRVNYIAEIVNRLSSKLSRACEFYHRISGHAQKGYATQSFSQKVFLLIRASGRMIRAQQFHRWADERRDM